MTAHELTRILLAGPDIKVIKSAEDGSLETIRSCEVYQSSETVREIAGELWDESTQHYIHEKLVEKAKERIATTELSISEIAYGLGFGHLQSFSRLFKAKTRMSPIEFRRAFRN